MRQGLGGVGVLLYKLIRGEQAGSRHGAAKQLLCAFERACVRNNFDLAALLQHGHGRVGAAEGVNLCAAQCHHRAGPCPHTHKRHIRSRQARTRKHRAGHQVG